MPVFMPELAPSELDGSVECCDLRGAVLSVMTQELGAREAQEAVEQLLGERRRRAWGQAMKEDGMILASILLDVKAYIMLSNQLNSAEGYVLDPLTVAEAPAHLHQR